jgi:hypothetical protein
MDLAKWCREDGLHLPADLPYGEWEAVGVALIGIEKSVQWWLGEWWLYGEHKYGERAAQAIPTGYAVATLRAAALVAARFPRDDRDPDVSFGLYREVVALPPEKAQELIGQAKEEHLSRTDLRERVRDEQSRAALVREQRRAEAMPEDKRTYPVIIADPPWEQAKLEDLCDYDLPVGVQAVLFLWCPMARLPAGLSVLEAWGFAYQGHLVWPETDHGQVGYVESKWVDVRHQLVLLGARGYMVPVSRPGTLLVPGYRQSHQEGLRDVIDAMYPELPRYEAFKGAPVPELVGL